MIFQNQFFWRRAMHVWSALWVGRLPSWEFIRTYMFYALTQHAHIVIRDLAWRISVEWPKYRSEMKIESTYKEPGIYTTHFFLNTKLTKNNKEKPGIRTYVLIFAYVSSIQYPRSKIFCVRISPRLRNVNALGGAKIWLHATPKNLPLLWYEREDTTSTQSETALHSFECTPAAQSQLTASRRRAPS